MTIENTKNAKFSCPFTRNNMENQEQCNEFFSRISSHAQHHWSVLTALNVGSHRPGNSREAIVGGGKMKSEIAAGGLLTQQ